MIRIKSLGERRREQESRDARRREGTEKETGAQGCTEDTGKEKYCRFCESNNVGNLPAQTGHQLHKLPVVVPCGRAKMQKLQGKPY